MNGLRRQPGTVDIVRGVGAGAPVVLGHSCYAMGLGARLLGIRPFLSSIVRLMFGKATRRRNPELVSEWKREFSTVHVPSVLFCLDALMRRDSLLARLPEIGVPAPVLVGEEDRSLPPFLARRIHDLLPDSRLVQIPEAGHLSALEQPAAVTEAILRFLDADQGVAAQGRRRA